MYLVTDEGGGEAALKLVDTSDAGARVRLSREVAALQALRHPAVPRVLDAELDDEDAFVVSEFIDGPSLSQHVRARGPLPSGQVAELASALAGALAAVHAAGVVHRDVTPANVLLGRTGPVLIDFGISHQFEDDRLTRTGLVSGTAGYVAPEVIDGGEPTAASDDWGLAATLAFAVVQPTIERVDEVAQRTFDFPNFLDQDSIVSSVVTVGVAFLFFLSCYRFLPNIAVATREVWRGAVIATAAFEASIRILPAYIGQDRGGAVISAFAGAFIVLVWFYLMALMLLIGGAYNWWWREKRRIAASHGELL